MSNLIAKNIMWDVDEEGQEEELPAEIEIPDGMTEEDEISDYLSDVTGFCHQGYELYGYEYAVEIADKTGETDRQIEAFDDYDKAVQLANAVNHDNDVLGNDEFVRVIRIDYEEGEEIGTDVMKAFDRNEPDANKLFNDVLEAVHCSIEPYKDEEEGVEGYRIYDEELGEYRSNLDEDVVATSAVMIMDELDAFTEDSFYDDLANELVEYGLADSRQELPHTLGELYVHIVLLANEELDGEGMKFWKAHEEELAMVDLICNRINEVDINIACPKITPEQVKDKIKEQAERGE